MTGGGGSSPGAILRAAREARHLSIADIAQATRIAVDQLEAIERDAWSALPEPVYVRSFLRSFAQAVVIDPGEVLHAYEQLPASQRAAGRARGVTLSPSPMRVPRALVVTPAVLAKLGVAALVVGVVAYLGIELATFARTPDLRVTDPPGDVASYIGTSYLVRGLTEPNATVRVDGLRENPTVTADAIGAFEVRVGLVPGANVISLVANDPLTGRDSAVVRRTIQVTSAGPGAQSGSGGAKIGEHG